MASFGYEFWDRVDDLKGRDDTLFKLAQVMGVKTQTLKNMRSECRLPKPTSIKCLADYLGVSTDYLITGEEKSAEPESPDYAYITKMIKDDPTLASSIANLIKNIKGEK